jgi:hypothetical protein
MLVHDYLWPFYLVTSLACAVCAVVIPFVSDVSKYPVGVVHLRWNTEKRQISERAHLLHDRLLYIFLWLTCFFFIPSLITHYSRSERFQKKEKDSSGNKTENKPGNNENFYGKKEDVIHEKQRNVEICFVAWIGLSLNTFAGGFEITTNLCQSFVMAIFAVYYHETWRECTDERPFYAALVALFLSVFCTFLTAVYAMREGNDVPLEVLSGNAATISTCYVCYFVALMYRRPNETNSRNLALKTTVGSMQKNAEAQLRVHYWCFTVSKIAFAAGLVCFNFFANP